MPKFTAKAPAGTDRDVPYGSYCAHANKTPKFKVSEQKGFPMVEASYEVYYPTEVDLADGSRKVTAGHKFNIYWMLVDESWGLPRVIDALKRLDYPFDDPSNPEIDTDHLIEFLKHTDIEILIDQKQRTKVYKEGPEKNKPVLDGRGNEIKEGWQTNVGPGDITGRATVGYSGPTATE
jgi:hypothetical protein